MRETIRAVETKSNTESCQRQWDKELENEGIELINLTRILVGDE